MAVPLTLIQQEDSAMTIYLYIKRHAVTGLKYFGKTKNDPYEYDGSGLYWVKHIQKYGREHIITDQVWEFNNQDECMKFALHFSKNNNIVESKEWANMRLENGKDGGGNNPGALNSFYGHTHSETFKRAASERMSNRIVSDKTRKKMSEYQKNKIRVYGKNGGIMV